MNAPTRWRVRLAWIAIAGAASVILWVSGRALAPRLLALMTKVDRLGSAAPIAFMLCYALGILLLVPSTLLTLSAGALFGIVHGVAYAFIGATLGSACAFLLGRHAARRLIERRLAEMPRLAAVERAAAAQGLRIVFLLRLSPVVPFNFLNYALGLTAMSVWDFMIAGFGSLPGDVMYAYWGRLGGEALALAADETAAPKSASYYAFLAGGLIATLAATAVVTRTARRALRDV